MEARTESYVSNMKVNDDKLEEQATTERATEVDSYAQDRNLPQTHDVAAKYFADGSYIVNPEEERKLVRKIDFRIIPILAVTNLLTLIDKATLGFAALFGLQKATDLHGIQYAMLGSIFYFGFLLFEFPSGWMLQRWSIPKWLGINLFLWSGILMALAGCNNFGQLAALRFLLGAFESCSTPSLLLITGMWYTAHEQPVRIAMWQCMLGVSIVIGGLLAYAIGLIGGSLDPWRYQFLIIGAVSVMWPAFIILFLPDSPVSARWLSASEKTLAVERLKVNQAGIKTPDFKWSQVREAFCDPKVWLFVLYGLASQAANGALSNFSGLIVKGFGYDQLQSALLQMPYGFTIIIANISAMFLQRWIPGQRRCMVACAYVLPAIAGLAGIRATEPVYENRVGRLVCFTIIGFYTGSYTMMLSLLVANTAGQTKKTTVNAMFFVSYCIGNAIGPFPFKANEAPYYTSGMVGLLVCYVIVFSIYITLWVYMKYLSKKKAQQAEEWIAANGQPDNHMAFRDLTDRENPFFVYQY